MLKQRIIPKFLVEDGRLIKYKSFINEPREAGNPVSTARIYNSYGVDELIVLDIKPDRQGQSGIDGLAHIVERMCDEIFMPVTVGGGITSLADVDKLLRSGADKICLNTAAVQSPELITKVANRYGSQCVVVSIDYHEHDGLRTVYSNSGLNNTGMDALDWAKRAVSFGAGEILLSSIPRDGEGTGYDTAFLAEAAAQLSVPVVGSGGAGSLHHCQEALEAGLSAITISSMFFFSDHSPIKVRSYLRSQGLPVRASKGSRN